MELDIQEMVIKYREEREAKDATKEALASTNVSIGTSSNTGKGKAPMEYFPKTSVEQQVKAYLHSLEQIKQRLRKMTLALDTQEVATSQPTEAAQVTTVGEKTHSEQTQVEKEPSQKSKITSIPTSTVDLTHSEEEDERVSPVPVTIEIGNGNYLHNLTTFLNGRNGKAFECLCWWGLTLKRDN